jgi:hypothetical protein
MNSFLTCSTCCYFNSYYQTCKYNNPVTVVSHYRFCGRYKDKTNLDEFLKKNKNK